MGRRTRWRLGQGLGAGMRTYAFESGVIRLNQKDYDQWKRAFTHLDLDAELIALAGWAQRQENWFFAVSAALAKRNREISKQIQLAQLARSSPIIPIKRKPVR